jgi:hypothetical protein
MTVTIRIIAGMSIIIKRDNEMSLKLTVNTILEID